jgi:hypothetical protein
MVSDCPAAELQTITGLNLSNMTAEMIREDRTLDIICLWRCEQISNQRGPSRVPDWLHLWNTSRRVPFLESQCQDWRQSYSRNPLVKGIDKDAIMVRGIFVDTILTLSTTMNSENEWENTRISESESARQGLKEMSHPSFGYSKKMWQTLCLMPKKNEFGFGLFELSPVPLFIWMCQDFTVGPNLRQWYQENKSTIFGGFTVQPWLGVSYLKVFPRPRQPVNLQSTCRALRSSQVVSRTS